VQLVGVLLLSSWSLLLGFLIGRLAYLAEFQLGDKLSSNVKDVFFCLSNNTTEQQKYIVRVSFAEKERLRMYAFHIKSSSNRLSPLDISETTHAAFIVPPEGIQI